MLVLGVERRIVEFLLLYCFRGKLISVKIICHLL